MNKKFKINEILTEKALSPTQIDIADFVINPYRGCQYGCIYCYAKNNKNVINRVDDWGNFVDVKINFADRLKEELELNKPGRVLIGSVTEVFQPVEENYRITEQVLVLLKSYNIPFVLLTKSVMIQNYIDLLLYSEENEIYFTINSKIVKELFEPVAPSQQLRVQVIEKLVSAGIKVNIYISPFFPELSDYEEIFMLIKNLPEKHKIGLYFESYNIQAGTWNEISKMLDVRILKKFEQIYKTESAYYDYWNTIKQNITEFNENYGFLLKFFIYPYNNYYNFFSYK